ncbi:Zinc transporter ZIP1 [Aphelenchoides bicaudatus]|nr:Zinc transporter ZIP1 [Aphelenchoides bicaudatus]
MDTWWLDQRANALTTPKPLVPTRNALKSILLLTLFFATFLASTSALMLKRAASATTSSPNSRASKIFSAVSCFGGGVFLATCLMHLLPESMEQIEKAEHLIQWNTHFPFAELCISLGFIFVLFVEQAIIFAHEKDWLGGHNLLHDGEHQEQHQHLHANEAEQPDDDEQHFEHETHSTMRAAILVLAISLHASFLRYLLLAVFEGLSVGMISDVAALLQICGALLIHKVLIGISLGVRLVQSKMRPRTVVICCAIFSSQILIGGLIGLAIVDVLNTESHGIAGFVSGILQAFAAGTFLYITCFEILPHELNKKGYRPFKILMLIFGFALITLFLIVFPDADDNDPNLQKVPKYRGRRSFLLI